MLLKRCVSLLSALSWLVITIMVHLNPSGTIPMKATSILVASIIWIGVPAFSFLMFWWLFRIESKSRFLVWVLVVFLIQIGLIFWAAAVVHRDYHSLLFQLILLFLSAALLQIPSFRIVHNKKIVFRVIGAFILIIFMAFLMWLMFMGYAIVTRSEPRWIEATVYNFVGAVISLLMLFSAVSLQTKAYRIFEVRGDAIFWDDIEITPHFSSIEKLLLLTFLHNHHSCSCCQLIEPIETGAGATCETCHAQAWSAIDCKNFRKVKKYTATLKKYLELLGIGTIVQVSENYRLIKKEGWKIRFFDDVLYHHTHQQ